MTDRDPAEPRARRRGVLVPVAAVALAVLVPITILVGSGFVLGWKFQPIETGSMAPRYPVGSLAVIVPVEPAEVQPGMVIVFTDPQQPGRQVAHRVVRKLPGDSLAWETKGDANLESDPFPVHVSALQGRIGWVVPGLGTVVTALRGPQAFLLLVALPLLVLAITEVQARRRRPKPPIPLSAY